MKGVAFYFYKVALLLVLQVLPAHQKSILTHQAKNYFFILYYP